MKIEPSPIGDFGNLVYLSFGDLVFIVREEFDCFDSLRLRMARVLAHRPLSLTP